MIPSSSRTRLVVVLAAATPIVLAGCTAKPSSNADQSGAITVKASDTSCEVSQSSASTGPSTFTITNGGSKVTEFYVYAAADRIMGEMENIGPGITRDLIVELPEAATYQTACKPGMVGDGIRADFTVTGDAKRQTDTDSELADATANYKRYVQSQTQALGEQTTAFTTAVTNGDVAAAKALYPIARTYYERIEPVAESFGDLDPKIDVREADLEEGQAFTGFHCLEKDLWTTGLQPSSATVAAGLQADITDLISRVNAPDYSLTPVDLANGAQGLLDEVATSKITGEEDTFSHTDLYDFQANVDGSQAAIAALAPVLTTRNQQLLDTITADFATLESTLGQYRQGDGFVDYTTVNDEQRKELSDQVDALAQQVSQVAGVVTGQ